LGLFSAVVVAGRPLLVSSSQTLDFLLQMSDFLQQSQRRPATLSEKKLSGESNKF
jgi:hypothetical protein